jgi:hypothetical protein
MSPKLILVAVVATLVAGGAVFAASYQLTAGQSSGPATSQRASVAATPAAATQQRPAPRVRWAPCAHGTHLVRGRTHRHGICVHDVVRTVTLSSARTGAGAAPEEGSEDTDSQPTGVTSPPAHPEHTNGPGDDGDGQVGESEDASEADEPEEADDDDAAEDANQPDDGDHDAPGEDDVEQPDD